jgi:hypothetical protein
MKRRRISTTAPRSAHEIVRKTLAQANDGKSIAWTRTTFKAPTRTVEELKVHATRLHLDMNDLLLWGAHMVLCQAGLPSHLTEADLRADRPKKRD